MDQVRAYGLAACGGVGVVAFVPLLVAARAPAGIGPPETLPRWLVLGMVIAAPAIVGAIGVRRRDRALLIAAAGLCLPLSMLSVATLPLAIPALLFLVAALSAEAALPRSAWLVTVAVVGLGVGSLVGLLDNTETRCWLAFDTPTGLAYRDATEAETEQPIGGPGGPIAAGCDGGALTIRGVGLAAVLAIGAVGLAIAAPRPRPAPA